MTKEHKESNGCEKYYCWRYALYKINFWTILKKLLQKNDFCRFPLFEIFAHISFKGCCSINMLSYSQRHGAGKLWVKSRTKRIALKTFNIYFDSRISILLQVWEPQDVISWSIFGRCYQFNHILMHLSSCRRRPHYGSLIGDRDHRDDKILITELS